MSAALQARAEAAADHDEWVLAQLKAWPTRIHPERTINIEYLMKEAAKRIDALQSEGWRPISEADQTIGNEVLGFAVYHGKPVRFVVEWNGHNWYAGWGDAIQPTHFMPLPAPPEERAA